MCAVRCPIEVTVEDGRVAWLQGNPNDEPLGTSFCAKGSAGMAFEHDDERPQTPLIRMGPRGGGQWRRASWDEALDYIADKLRETIAAFGPRGIVLSDRGGLFTDLTRTFLQVLGSPNYFNHDVSCAGNLHNAALSILGFAHTGLVYDMKNTRHLVLSRPRISRPGSTLGPPRASASADDAVKSCAVPAPPRGARCCWLIWSDPTATQSRYHSGPLLKLTTLSRSAPPWVAPRFVVDQADPAGLALLRYVVASCCLLPFVLGSRPPPARFDRRDLAPIAILGIVGSRRAL
jgi:hypothetical protein